MTPGMGPRRTVRPTRAGGRGPRTSRDARSLGAMERSLREAWSAGGPRAEAREARATARLIDRAWSSRLVDVAYAWTDSPFGPLLVAVTRRGLVRVAYPDLDVDRELEELSAAVSPRVVESRRATDEVRRELEEYFGGRRRRFDLPVDLTPVHGFTRKVLAATSRIPFGSVRTYREVAGKAGNPAATRAAGNALGSNPVPIVVPCHRVIRTGGGLGGYTGGLERKEVLLRLEGALPPT